MKFFYITPIILQGLIWLPTRIILRLFCRLEIRGLDNLKNIKSNVIFASNHTSELDAFIVASSLPFWSHFTPLYFASRENKFYDTSGWRQHFYGGLFFKLWGAQPVNSGLRDYEKSLANQIKLLQENKSVLLFPEGHITNDGSIQTARGGVAYLSRRMNKIIVPVAISGAYDMSISDFFFRQRKIIIRFGSLIYSDELDIVVSRKLDSVENIYKREAAYVMERVKEELAIS